MVSGAPRTLTKIGFRRDVKMFLALLIGFLVVLILALLMLLQVNVRQTEDAIWAQWELTADLAADTLTNRPSSSGPISSTDLLLSRGRYGLAAIEVRQPGRPPVISGYAGPGTEHVERKVPGATAIVYFDGSPIVGIRRRFLLTALIVFGATILSTLLMLAYLPKIVRPIDEMLDHARQLGDAGAGVDEATYLIETFRISIATMKEQEAELKQLHEREKMRADDLERVTATLTRNLTSGFIAVDAAGNIVDLNGAAREILRLPSEPPLAGVPLATALGESAFAATLRSAFAARETLARHEVTVGAKPDAQIIGLTTVPLTNESDAFLGMLALFSDLTPVRQLETRLRETQTLAELGEISAGIAHEFRNSLSTILGYLRLARRHDPPPELASKLTMAEQEAAVLAGAVDGLLAFARPMAIERQPVDLMKVCRDVVERLTPSLDGIAVTIDGGPLEIEGDATLLTRALDNVVRNAVDAVRMSDRPGSIAIVGNATPYPHLEVRDSGVGLDAADAARLFLPFQSDKPSGLGLGLPLARKIVVLHGGSIRMSGERGRGAEVVIEFPYAPRAAAVTKSNSFGQEKASDSPAA